MIFVVVGTQRFQLDRLLRALDELAGKGLLQEEILAQIGYSRYKPRYYAYVDFLPKAEFDATVARCDLLLTHGGVGAIVAGLRAGKPVVVFPRLAKYREHVDDHQTELARVYAEQGYLLVCGEQDDLLAAIHAAQSRRFRPYEPPRNEVAGQISAFLDGRGKSVILNEAQRRQVQRIQWEMLCELDRICRKHQIGYTLAYGTMLGAVRHGDFIPWDDDVDVCMLRPELERFRAACAAELDPRYFYQTNATDPAYFHLFDKLRANGTVFKERVLAPYAIHHGVYLDIFPVDYLPNGVWARKAQYYQFHFYRTGLMVKYLALEARQGKKKWAARVLRVLYAPFSLRQLYEGANRAAARYNGSPAVWAQSFCSPYRMRDVFRAESYQNRIELPFGPAEFSVSADFDEMLRRLYGEYWRLPPEEERNTRHELAELKL